MLPLFGSPYGLWLSKGLFKKKDIPLTQLILAVLWSMLLITCDVGARLSAVRLSKDNIDFYHDVEIGKNILQGSP